MDLNYRMCYTDLAINKNLDIIKLHLNFLFVILKYHQYNYRKLRSYGGSDMKFKNPMLVVTDIEKSVEFYKKVFGLHVIMDFGANKTLTGGLALQTVETYKDFIGTNDISFGGNNFEIYFEEDDFDKFADRLKEYDIEYVHPIIEHSWGQRVVRFYDPDKHIVEVGENMKIVCKRFLDSGMTPEQVAEFMNVPMKFIKACMR
ncbi:VOC family protein [Thomasclavelia cocleata]|mgnify:CR=1 FL=1|jgi:lactoylglutathione lyase|nr:VOC family protein [Thomasclavelia cocleata]